MLLPVGGCGYDILTLADVECEGPSAGTWQCSNAVAMTSSLALAALAFHSRIGQNAPQGAHSGNEYSADIRRKSARCGIVARMPCNQPGTSIHIVLVFRMAASSKWHQRNVTACTRRMKQECGMLNPSTKSHNVASLLETSLTQAAVVFHKGRQRQENHDCSCCCAC